MYAKYFKRVIDFILSLMALIVLSPVLLILIVAGAIAMKGNPVFTQIRPGKDEKLFKLINILKGDMSVVGPRPQLVRDMVFMTEEQRQRHTVRPGLSGLAQCNGRNNMTWEKKFEYDAEYIKKITFWGDIKIIMLTVVKVFQEDGITMEGMATAADLGDYLLYEGRVSEDEYEEKIREVVDLIGA